MAKKKPLYPHVPKSRGQEADIKIERYHGFITLVGGATVKTLPLPDWSLEYIEFPPGEMPEYRKALMQERVKIVQVTDSRIYFSQ
ncbi:hypothetical protein ES703_69965 [subsurface metagenome]